MTFDLDIGGRRRQVQLERVSEGWRATVDGRTTMVNAVPVCSGWSVLVRGGAGDASPPDGQRLLRGGSYDASVEDRRQGELVVHVAGYTIPVRPLDPRRLERRRSRDQGGSAIRRVTTPMPGRIVKVFVKSGDRVARGQGLVVVEAMKMENELRAPDDAIVRDVRVTEGSSVEASAVLVILE